MEKTTQEIIDVWNEFVNRRAHGEPVGADDVAAALGLSKAAVNQRVNKARAAGAHDSRGISIQSFPHGRIAQEVRDKWAAAHPGK
jgi:biotin operon repressor